MRNTSTFGEAKMTPKAFSRMWSGNIFHPQDEP